MRKLKLLLALIAICGILLPAQVRAQERTDYTYIHNEGEYSVVLPDAPSGQTIWADDQHIPFIENPPKYGAIGEYAILRRTDTDTGDTFKVHITFLKVDRDFLLSLTKEKLQEMIEADYEAQRLDKSDIKISTGENTLKWGIITGYTVDKANNLLYHAGHYLTGLETLTVIKVSYNIENPTFEKFYKTLAASIKYTGK